MIPLSEDERFQKLREIADKMDKMGKDLIASGVPYGFSIVKQAQSIREVIE